MFEQNKLGIWTRVFLSLALLAVLIGGGYAVYRMGYTQGAIATEAGDLAISEWLDRPTVGHGHYYPYGNDIAESNVVGKSIGSYSQQLYPAQFGTWQPHTDSNVLFWNEIPVLEALAYADNDDSYYGSCPHFTDQCQRHFI